MIFFPRTRSIVSEDRKILFFIFFAGILCHLIYLSFVISISSPTEWDWLAGDSASYMRPAETFVNAGSFLRHNAPDYRRTIGYPMFLSLMIFISGKIGTNLQMTIYVTQAIIFALVYPAIYLIGVNLFGLWRKTALLCIVFTVSTGAFISYVPLALSDGIFSTTLIVGIACSLIALQKRSFLLVIFYIVLITYAANVRPMLAFFPFAMFFLHIALVKYSTGTSDRTQKILVTIMFVFTLIGVQTPALRNWIHHGVFTPTEIGSINLFNYLAKEVLIFNEEQERYKKVVEELSNLNGPELLEQRIALRKTEAINVFVENPLKTIGLVTYYSVLNSLEMHWQNFFVLFKKTWYRDYDDGSVKWSPIPFLVAIVYIAVYANVYLISFFWLIFSNKNYYLLIAFMIFAIPYIFCGTSYQGSRFRLWLEPVVILYMFSILQRFFEMIRSNFSVTQLKLIPKY